MPLPYVEFAPDDSSLLTCCQRACPVGTDVSAYVALVAQGRFREALAIVREGNPFPSVCGRVCDHACEVHCRRAESDQPVSIRVLKRFLADRERGGAVDWPERLVPSRSQRVAIIGGGPAGLTAASDLLRRGFPVTVFEALPVAGGMMRVGIPDYRLPPDVLDFDLEHLRRLGVDVKLNTALGRDFSLSDLRAEGYEATLLATGTHASRELNVQGSDLPGVIAGIDFIRQAKLGGAPKLGQRVVVIGGGDVAMDSARTALRLGAERVDLFCLESRDEMPAHDWEAREALDERIRFHCAWGPTRLIGHDRVEQVEFIACTSVFDSSGQFAPTLDPSESTTVDADAVLHAIGQVGQFAHAADDGVEVTPARLYRIDRSTLRTTAPWIFAAGDAAYGTATVVEAVASGHRAGASICEYLEGRPLTGCWEPVLHAERVERIDVSHDWGELPAAEEPELPADKRIRSFSEVKLGLDEAAAVLEASRCMRCDHETDSHTYSRLVREQVYHLARDVGEDEDARLHFLHQKLCESRDRPRAEEHVASLDDLLFLPANLTRLVIDPYREQCNTHTVIGDRATKPLELSGPIVVGGLPFEGLAGEALAGLCQAARDADTALRMEVGVEPPTDNVRVVRVAPLGQPRGPVNDASAVELHPEASSASLDADTLRSALEAYRQVAPHVPIGVSVGPGQVASDVRAATEAGLDFVTLLALETSGLHGSACSAEASRTPRIEVLTEAIEALRAINREEDIDLIYFGGVRGGADAAKALALGANAVMIGAAALIAAGAGEPDADRVAESVSRFVQATLMEVSILARCCGKTDVHNLEPEDLRSLTIETSRATGVPLAGRDVVYRRAAC